MLISANKCKKEEEYHQNKTKIKKLQQYN